ncbi:MAG: RimK family alpha-L-glutamate ligase [Chloroflexota bacterium]
MRRKPRIGVVTSDPGGWHTNQLLAAVKGVGRGEVVSPLSVSVRIDGRGAAVNFGDELASSFDALLLRGLDSQGLPDFQLEAYHLMEDSVPVTVNRVGPILTALDKCRTSFVLRQSGLPTPATLVTQSQQEAEAAVEEYGEAVLKPLYGSLGEDLARVSPGVAANEEIARMLRAFGAVYVQQFLPPGGRDIRAFVVGGRVVAAIYRVARAGEWITNVFRGARTEPVHLTPALDALAVRATQVVGLDYTGVDIIEGPEGPMVLEVNGTPSWMGVDKAWRGNMASEIVAMVVDKVDRGRGGTGLRATA